MKKFCYILNHFLCFCHRFSTELRQVFEKHFQHSAVVATSCYTKYVSPTSAILCGPGLHMSAIPLTTTARSSAKAESGLPSSGGSSSTSTPRERREEVSRDCCSLAEEDGGSGEEEVCKEIVSLLSVG